MEIRVTKEAVRQTLNEIDLIDKKVEEYRLVRAESVTVTTERADGRGFYLQEIRGELSTLLLPLVKGAIEQQIAALLHRQKELKHNLGITE